jgi:hypothetical protein
MVDERQTTIYSENPGAAFLPHMDISACHNDQKITSQHPIDFASTYPPDLSPRDFCLFGFLKESLNIRELTTEDHIVEAITTIWRGINFETLQSVLQEWMRRLIRVIDNNVE